MTDPKTLGAVLRKVAWAHVFITFSLNIETLDILPAWVGYLMVAGTLAALAAERPHVETLRPMVGILAALSAVIWIGKAFSLAMPYAVGLIHQIVQLIFFFSFHSELAELGRSYGWTGADRLLMVRNASIAVAAPCWLAEWMESRILMALLIASATAQLLLWWCLFDLSKYFRYKT